MKTAKSRLSFRTKAIIAGVASTLGLAVAAYAPVSAASTFTDHLWKFANGAANNAINFNKVGSKIYENGNLHIATDDNLYLDASTTNVKGTIKVTSTATGTYMGSRIYDNAQLHIATDDYLYLDAPQAVNVSNKLVVNT